MKLKHALVKIFLTATAVSLAGCSDGFPDLRPKLVSLEKQRVLPYELVDKEKVRFAAVRDSAGKPAYKPLSVIDGGYCLSAKEIADVLAWVRRNKDKDCQ